MEEQEGIHMYESLFESLNISTLEIKNRFVMPAMDSHYTTHEHQYSEQALNYYGERAKGGFGLLITEYMCVSEEGLSHSTQAGIYDDCFIPMLSRLVERIHEEGGKVFAQLQHSGRKQGTAVTSFMPVGASCIPAEGCQDYVHELTDSEVQLIKGRFKDAAVRARRAGFDGVEIHAAHGYLLAQFLSKETNKRVDQYGGTITDRARIVCEIIQDIKAACGAPYPVSIRIGGQEDTFGGNDIEDAIVQSLLFEAAGADVINVSCGTAIHSYFSKPGFNLELTRRIKEILSIPVIGIGRINDPTLALAAVKGGYCDFVALGRQSICDPHFPEKVKNGCLEEILTCTGCMQRCLYSNFFEEGYGTSCMINPFSGKEGMWCIEEAQNKKKIAVIGAGPAGLQAAWILGKKGHHVTVYEKEIYAGGQYRLAAMPPMKQELGKTISTYLAFCKKYGVEIRYNTKADKKMLEKECYDEIILAVGAVPFIPGIKGISGGNVCRASDILTCHNVLYNQKILVLGAGLVGAETAEFLAGYHNDVTIVDMIDGIAPTAPPRPRSDLLEHLEHQKVRSVLESRVLEILGDGIKYVKSGEVKELHGYNTIVLAFGACPDRAIYKETGRLAAKVHIVGDAAEAGDAKKAIFEATELALKI